MARVIPARRARWRDALALLVVLAIAGGVGWLYVRDARSRERPTPGKPPASPVYDVARRELDALLIKGWDGFRSAFVARQVEVKTDYRLWVSAREKDAMRRVLRDC